MKHVDALIVQQWRALATAGATGPSMILHWFINCNIFVATDECCTQIYAQRATIAMSPSNPTPDQTPSDLEKLILDTKQRIADIEASQKAGRPVIPQHARQAAEKARARRTWPLAIAAGVVVLTVDQHLRQSRVWEV